MRAAALLLLLALGLVAAQDSSEPAPPADAFLVARKWAGAADGEGRTVVGRPIDVTVEVFNAGTKCVLLGGWGGWCGLVCGAWGVPLPRAVVEDGNGTQGLGAGRGAGAGAGARARVRARILLANASFFFPSLISSSPPSPPFSSGPPPTLSSPTLSPRPTCLR